MDAPIEPRITPRPSDRQPPPLNIFRTLAANRELRTAFLALGSHLLTGGTLSGRDREIVILRVGWRAQAEYEFGQHRVLGREAGLTDDEIRALCGNDLGDFSHDDHVLVNMVDELCDKDVVSAATWESLASRFDDATMLELLVLAGFYRLVSGMLNSVGVPLEPTALGWPDGVVATRTSPREQP